MSWAGSFSGCSPRAWMPLPPRPRRSGSTERQPPSIAIAWVLGMIAVPYLALPSYLMFGRRKLPRRVLNPAPVATGNAHWAEDLIQSFGLAPAAPSSVNLHSGGAESAAALFD